jgi:uncharacterized protein (DUF2345 family)
MGILGKIFAGKLAANAMNRANRRTDLPAEGQYIPAARSDIALGAPGSILDRAGQFYKQNPKKVHALGAVAAAILLTRLGQRR